MKSTKDATVNHPPSRAWEQAWAIRRISPVRNRWPELRELDVRVANLEGRKQRVVEELRRLRLEHRQAPEQDARALADWLAGGEKGRKPEATESRIEERVRELERERDGVQQLIERTLEKKAAYVERNRKRLVRSADKAVVELRTRYEQLVDELAQTRDELAESRGAALWAATFPSDVASTAPPMPIAGGQRRVLEAAGVTAQLQPDQAWKLLREDARWLESATTSEQRKAMGLKRPDAATWTGTAEGIETERQERKQALERYRQLWGRDPA